MLIIWLYKWKHGRKKEEREEEERNLILEVMKQLLNTTSCLKLSNKNTEWNNFQLPMVKTRETSCGLCFPKEALALLFCLILSPDPIWPIMQQNYDKNTCKGEK